RRPRSRILGHVFGGGSGGIFRLGFGRQEKNRGERPDAAERAAEGPEQLAAAAVLGDDAAQDEAERSRAEACEEARRVRLEAEDYVDAKLAQLEAALKRISEELGATGQYLARTVEQVEAGRTKLRGGSPAQQEFAPEETGEG